MPKAKTMLDELARVLKARKNAVQRVDRRFSDQPNLGRRGLEESRRLIEDLDDRAVMEYDRLMRSNPSRKDMRDAIRMMPDALIRDYDYFDR